LRRCGDAGDRLSGTLFGPSFYATGSKDRAVFGHHAKRELRAT
jgi:hypothetical protein